MKTEGEADDLIDQSEADLQQHILERLWHRNWVRKQIGLRPLDIAVLYVRKTTAWKARKTKADKPEEANFRDEKTR